MNILFESLITPIYIGQRTKLLIKKRFITEKWRKNSGLRISNFVSEMALYCPARKIELIFGCLQTILLRIVGELAGEGP